MRSMFKSVQAVRGKPLCGEITVPGDKSISHRALIISSIAIGTSKISGILEGADVLTTKRAMQALGATIECFEDCVWSIVGRGVGGLRAPNSVLDLGNSGTTARLLMGLLSTHNFNTILTGDASLCKRPMDRVIIPLRMMGGDFESDSRYKLPLTVKGNLETLPINYKLPMASAQVKSAIILAGLNAPGSTVVSEPIASRDHTENLLRAFGANIRVEELGDGARSIAVEGQPELKGTEISIPGDISSAAFPLVAALIVPNSKVKIVNVGINPLRIGLINVLSAMGGKITITNKREKNGELIGDIEAKSSSLRGVRVSANDVPAMIDEFPILAVAAAFASGETRMEGLSELRIKESDRLLVIANSLTKLGIKVEIGDDWLIVSGVKDDGCLPEGGSQISVELDHRIAMSFLVMGLASSKPISIDDYRPVVTSFPNFAEKMQELGADLSMDLCR